MANDEYTNNPASGEPEGAPAPAPQAEPQQTPQPAQQPPAGPQQATTQTQPTETPAPVAAPAEEPAPAPDKKKKKEKAPKPEKKPKPEPEPEPEPAPVRRRPNGQERRRRRHRSHPRRYWIRRHRRRYLRHLFKRIFLFTVAVLLGVMLTLGLLVGGAFMALGGLTIDFLQHFGIAKGADEYLTDQGEVDLTKTSLLELIWDLRTVGTQLSSHTMQTLLDRYGLRLPEEVSRVLPTDLFQIPLSRLLSEEGGTAVTENLTLGYFLNFLPEGMLSPQVVEKLSPRPLSLLVNSDWLGLLGGLQLGYFTGVTYDDAGHVVYRNPEVPTPQELLAELDLGGMMDAMTKNGDFLAVLHDDLGDKEVGALISGLTEGALIDTMVEGKTLADVITLNEETGRYELSFNALAGNVYLGQVLNYVKVEEHEDPLDPESPVKIVWYEKYDAEHLDDPEYTKEVTGMEKYMADVALQDLINGTLSLETTFDGLFFGDMQSGYARGEALHDDPGEPEKVTGYEWTENGDPVKAMAKAIANIKVSDVLSGNLDVGNIMGDLAFGDLQNYVRHEDGKWYETQEPPAEDKYVGAVQNALAKIRLSDVVDGGIDLDTTLAGLKAGDAMGYIAVEETDPLHPEDPPKTVWYEKYDADHLDDPEKTKKADGRDAAFADIAILDLIKGELNLDSTLEDMTLADAMNYTKVADEYYSTYSDDGDDSNDVKVTGILAVLAPKKLNNIGSSVGTVRIGEVLGYTAVEETDPLHPEDPPVTVWYEKYDADHLDDPALTKRAEGIMVSLADLTVDDLSNDDTVTEKVGDITLADALGYKYADGVYYTTYLGPDDPGNVEVEGILSILAPKKINAIDSSVGTIKIGEALKYTAVDEGDPEHPVWYETYIGPGDPANVEATGVMAHLADLTIDDLSNSGTVTDKIGEITLGDALGYKYVDGVWYEKYDADHLSDPELTKKASSVMATLADKRIDGMSNAVNDAELYKILGYTEVDEEYYITYIGPDDPGNEKASGVLTQLADLKVGELSDNDKVTAKINGIKLADALGYQLVGGVYYSTYVAPDDPGNVKVEGILSVLAPKKLNEIEGSVGTMKIGEVMKYTAVEEGAPPETVWYETYVAPGDPGNKVAAGMMATLADLTIDDLSDPDTVSAKVGEITLADALGYKYVGGVWYETYVGPGDPGNKKASAVMATLADTRIDGMSDAVNDAELYKILGYTRVGEEYYITYIGPDDPGNEKASGVLTQLADLKVGDLSDNDKVTAKINNMQLADVLGYEKHDGNWYTTYDPLHPDDHKVTGVLAQLMESRVGDLSTTIDDVKLGAAMGYYEDGGVWYEDAGHTVPVTGVLKAFAPLTTGELSNGDTIVDTIDALTLGDALGYTKEAGVWYDKGHNEAHGIIGALCDTRIDGLGAAVDTMKLGTMLDYEEHGGVWYSTYSDDGNPANDVRVTGILATLSNKTIGQLGDAVSDLRVADVFGYEEHGGVWYSTYIDEGDPGNEPVSGIVQLIGPATRIDQLDNVNLESKTLQDFYNAGVFIDETRATKLQNNFGDSWRTMTLIQLLDALLAML